MSWAAHFRELAAKERATAARARMRFENRRAARGHTYMPAEKRLRGGFRFAMRCRREFPAGA